MFTTVIILISLKYSTYFLCSGKHMIDMFSINSFTLYKWKRTVFFNYRAYI